MKIISKHIYLLTILFIIILFTESVYAYLDPGTGSYVIQILLAALAAVLFFIKIYFSKVKSFFKRIFSKKKES